MNAQRQTMVIQLQNTSFHVLMSTNEVVCSDNQLFFNRTTFCKFALCYKSLSSIIIPNLLNSSIIETVGVS